VIFYSLSPGEITMTRSSMIDDRCSSQLKPSMMTPLLRKLVHDVPALTDQTIVPLRVSSIERI
jgi:hypothetical protein